VESRGPQGTADDRVYAGIAIIEPADAAKFQYLMRNVTQRLILPAVFIAGVAGVIPASQAADPADQPAYETVEAIKPPLHPLPPEVDSADVTRFSFLVYGDTRGRRDGVAAQHEHSLVIDSMLDEIRKL